MVVVLNDGVDGIEEGFVVVGAVDFYIEGTGSDAVLLEFAAASDQAVHVDHIILALLNDLGGAHDGIDVGADVDLAHDDEHGADPAEFGGGEAVGPFGGDVAAFEDHVAVAFKGAFHDLCDERPHPVAHLVVVAVTGVAELRADEGVLEEIEGDELPAVFAYEFAGNHRLADMRAPAEKYYHGLLLCDCGPDVAAVLAGVDGAVLDVSDRGLDSGGLGSLLPQSLEDRHGDERDDPENQLEDPYPPSEENPVEDSVSYLLCPCFCHCAGSEVLLEQLGIDILTSAFIAVHDHLRPAEPGQEHVPGIAVATYLYAYNDIFGGEGKAFCPGFRMWLTMPANCRKKIYVTLCLVFCYLVRDPNKKGESYGRQRCIHQR